jgi:NADPH:quinone reductase-like Zn-dependent oxidoreductase
MGYYASAKEYVGWPITPGFEFAGIVSAVGKNVKDMPPGTRVFGVSRFDAYATHVAVPRYQVYLLPNHISFEEAAGFPVIYLTAYYALYMLVHIFPGSTILIHSAAGGVGSALLQLARLGDWRTIGVVGSSHKVEEAKALGADWVIDKSKENLWHMVEKYAPQGLDAVLDGNGITTIQGGYKHLRPTGKLISYGYHAMFARKNSILNHLKLIYSYLRTPRFHPIDLHNTNRSLASFNLSFLFDRSDLLEIAMRTLYSWFREGKIRMPKITVYSFREVARAHRDLQFGKTIGKLILNL